MIPLGKMSGQSLNAILNRLTTEVVQLRKDRKRVALLCWEPIVREILDEVKRKDHRFRALHIFPTGSYYERVKIKEPDEFDLMLIMDNLELDDAPFEEEDGFSPPPFAFTTVMIDMGEERLWQQDRCVNRQGMLKASQVKAVFGRLVREAIMEKRYRNVDVKSEGPAVTLKITEQGREYSVDLTLAIKDYTWPEDAEEWQTRHRNGWPKQDLVKGIVKEGCHLVAKQPKGQDIADRDKGFLWRYSFSAAEKKLFLQGGQGEASSCRKQVLRIVKALREELDLKPLKSYHLKTLLLYECESHPNAWEWSHTTLGDRFLGLLKRLENCLNRKHCPHYFIENLNLFQTFNSQECQKLAKNVRMIRSQPMQELIKLINRYQMA